MHAADNEVLSSETPPLLLQSVYFHCLGRSAAEFWFLDTHNHSLCILEPDDTISGHLYKDLSFSLSRI